MEYATLAFTGCAIAVLTLRNWRLGFYMFFICMLFEDLARKYMGNSTALFFGKDVVLAFVYISFYCAILRGREKFFRPPFLVFLSLFFWLALAEIFNQNSPSIFYGLLGFKLYFYYVPLMYLGYALIRSEEELRKFLLASTYLAIVIASVGIVQSVVGNSFLNPANLAPALRELGDLEKTTPISGQVFNLPPSVFVSTGRYSTYLIVAGIVTIGTAGYLLLCKKPGRKVTFLAVGILSVATVMCGNRGAFVSALMSAFILCAGFLWGIGLRRQLGRSMIKAIRGSLVVVAVGMAALMLFLPKQSHSRVDFYAETLLPTSSSYELGFRVSDYPMENFLRAFEGPHWLEGNGTGVNSLGTQYVSQRLNEPPPNVGVEEGFGNLVVEMGILGPILWILWAGALLYYSWRATRDLRGTRFFPIALAIWWYAFLLLCILTYGSLGVYQDYVNNVYLWLLVGILFRLPDLVGKTSADWACPSSPSSA